MKRWGIIIGITFFTISFFVNLLGLMGLFPIFITTPLLFLSLLFTLYQINNRKRFRGFRRL